MLPRPSLRPGRATHRRSRRARALLVFGLATSAACATGGSVPDESELPGLRARVERSRGDVESVLRLASGFAARGDLTGAGAVLEYARAEVPEVDAYAAGLGTTAERAGDFMTARDRYLDFVASAGPSRLTSRLAEHATMLRGKTADPIARTLVDDGVVLDHGSEPSRVIALRRFETPPDDDSVVRVAIALTELVLRDLRQTQLRVIDWELTEAVRRLVAPDAQPNADRLIAERLSAGVVVSPSISRDGSDSLLVVLRVLRAVEPGRADVAVDTIVLGRAFAPADRSLLSTRAVEMALGAAEGSVAGFPRDGPVSIAPEVLDQLGAGLLAADRGDDAGALAAFAEANRLAPAFPAAGERLRQYEELSAFQSARALPLADEILSFARAAARARAARRAAAGGWEAVGALTRNGPGEVFGLDRLGSQVFLDLLITVEGR